MAAPTTGNDYAPCADDGSGNCALHGGVFWPMGQCRTGLVLEDVRAERTRQFAQYGSNSDLLDGTGPDEEWIPGLFLDAKEIQTMFRREYEEHEKATGKPTWLHLVLEEVAEAFQEKDLVRLRAEVLQVAGLAVSWLEKLDDRIDSGNTKQPMSWTDVEAKDVKPGDIALHVDGHDGREVYASEEVDGRWYVWLLLATDAPHGPFESANYTFRRRVS